MIPLVAVTGEAQVERQEDFLSKGFSAILTKPLTMDMLHAILHKLLD